jgi:RNA binding exosome subunit
MYKKQIQELHEQVLNDEMKMKKLEYEYKSLEEINTNLRIDKQKLQNDCERLKETNEQLSINAEISANNMHSSESISTNSGSGQQDMDGLFSSVELFNIPNETK